MKFLDDTILLGLISDGDETSYKEEVRGLVAWCSANKLLLNTSKTKQMVMDWKRKKIDPAPLQIEGICLERVSSFRFLGVHVADDLRWHVNTAAQQVVSKVQQRLHFLRLLNKCDLEVILRQMFYHSTVESMLAYGITSWYAGCTANDRRVMKTAQKIIVWPLSSLNDTVDSKGLNTAKKILAAPSHHGRSLFNILPSGMRSRVLTSRTN